MLTVVNTRDNLKRDGICKFTLGFTPLLVTKNYIHERVKLLILPSVQVFTFLKILNPPPIF